MSDHQALLFVNEAFYRAFADRDAGLMESLWSETAPLTCIHPGWGLLEGHDDVLEGWSAIISNPESPNIACRSPTAHLYGDTGIVVCFEQIDDQFLIATNIFVREGRLWKMVHHQSGPTADVPEPDLDDEPDLVN
jgi:SnoaL-like protein